MKARKQITKQKLIDFERRIASLFEQGKIPYLTHFSGGNEDQLIEIFKDIKEGDYVFSTHRSHYHYLLAGGLPEDLERMILEGKSMFVFNKSLNFFSSSIVAGTPAIAAGVSLALKNKGNKNKVWCFCGDGAEDEGHFYEAVRYTDGWDLPCTFIIEDNNRSVETPKKERYGKSEVNWPSCVRRYNYIPTYPHAGTRNFVKITKTPEIFEAREEYLNLIYESKTPKIKMKYKDAIKKSMEMLAKNDKVIFIGYNVRHSSANGTLLDISLDQRLETPLAENLMIGLGMGMSLEGYRPVVFFERHDFIFNALDGIVNHLDKIKKLSEGQYQMPIIIRAVVGSKKPIYPGITHTQDFTSIFRNLFSFPVYDPQNSQEVLKVYKKIMDAKTPVLITERRELYEQE